ncbi:MAG TPA: DUF5666 domain-containing protein [Candidatus Limnocylindrales bacterium]|nr:DUF5666 domain-containing protein [Candidatus Limnocylindrales bacterium]
MKKKSLIYFVLAAVLPLGSCSGLKNGGCTTNCGGGNATLSISLYDTAPTGMDLLSFTLPIAGISLTPSSGSQVSITPTVTSVETTRLQTDSVLLVDAVSVAAGSYTKLNVTLGPTTATSGVFVNTSGSTITWTTGSGGSCANGAVCFLPAGVVFTVPVALSLNLSASQDQWVGLNLNLNNAITTAGGLSVDFSQANVLTAITSPRTGIPANGVDTIEDFIGAVTAYSAGSSITVQSTISGQKITAALNANTEYDTPTSPNTNYSGCSASPSCLKVGSTVSLDAVLSVNGTLTASEVDVLDVTAADEVEGVIYPTATAGVYGLILSDKISASGNAVLGASTTTYGTPIFLTVTNANTFVDTKTLSSVLSNPVGFANTSSLLAGQVVRAQVKNVTSTNNGITATATNLLLRFSRLSGTVSSVAGTVFYLTPPSYVSTFDAGLVPPLTSYTYTTTAFDGATSVTAGATASIRALFLNSTQPTFAVAKVRVP